MTQDESEDVWERNPLLSLTGPRSPEIVLIDISLQQQEFPIGSLYLHARRKTQAVFRVETENESARVLIVHQAKRSKKWQKCSVCSLSMKTRCSARYRMVNWRLHQLSTTFIMKDDYRWVFFFLALAVLKQREQQDEVMKSLSLFPPLFILLKVRAASARITLRQLVMAPSMCVQQSIKGGQTRPV